MSLDDGITWTDTLNLVKSAAGDGNKLDLITDMSVPLKMRIKIKTQVTGDVTKIGEWQYINLSCS